jgi:isoleucyl-tRNA synthetase
MVYRPVDPKVDFPALERRILDFWRTERVFERSLEARRAAPPWVFYEGPPTANGRPGIHHVESRTFKDLFPRYLTMTGHLVERRAGWDCHGLPVELEVEKEIGTTTKRDIEEFGIAEFNRLCRESVTRYVDDWGRLTERIGFWIDLSDAYWTMTPRYIESVWWSLKRLYLDGLLTEADRSVAYCPRCGTALSDHEVAMGYTTVTDPSVYVKFRITEAPDPDLVGSSILAWTTTPWTLPSNLGLAVDPDAMYGRWVTEGHDVIVATQRREAVLGDVGEPKHLFQGRRLLDGVTRYEPLYPNVEGVDAHRVVGGDFVSLDEGTGIVHIAPGFGPDDLAVGQREGWPTYKPLDDAGRFTEDTPVPFVRGLFVKDADPPIIDDLRERSLLFQEERYRHTYPLCWRCDTPLLYMARTSWYVRTTERKERLLETNESVNWYPEHIKHGRYGDWLQNNVDWALSRERYWGTPLPLWRCPAGHVTPVGSLHELSERAGRDVTGIDPHRPDIDEVVFACPECGADARRVAEVIDTWYDSGAMPYAQWGYQPELGRGQEGFERSFPADFISEGIDQTRGWFYSLMAESVLLFDRTSYRNCVVLGLLLDAEGRKMSKRLGNVIDPWEAVDSFGADAVRWHLVTGGSPWSDRRISMDGFESVVRQFLLTLWNVYSFFVTYANADRIDVGAMDVSPAERPVLDRWILSRLASTTADARDRLDRYDATGAGRRIAALVDDLSNWYVRRARRRFWDPAGSSEAALDKGSAYRTLHECLTTVARLLAPFIPFVTEDVWRNLAAGRDGEADSVHLTDYPKPDRALVDAELESAMHSARAIASLGRTVRNEARIKVRQPLARAVVHHPGDHTALQALLDLVAEELNVREVAFAESAEELAGWRARPSFKVLGPRLGPAVKEVAAALAKDDGSMAARLARGERITVTVGESPLELGPDDVDLSQETEAGWGVSAEGGLTVALDLEVTPELREEGAARDLLRVVQDARKDAGLAVTDRIDLAVLGSDHVQRLLERHGAWIAAEALAVTLAARDPSWKPDHRTSAHLDGEPVEIALRRAAGG